MYLIPLMFHNYNYKRLWDFMWQHNTKQHIIVK